MQNDYAPLKVLVVDDEPLIRSGISRYLGNSAFVTAVSSAEDALVAMGSCHYDLCLLDVFLPGMNGVDAMQKMKEMSPLTKVAIMTGSHLDEAMKRRIENEAYDFLEKPFDLSRIKEIALNVIMATNVPNKGPSLPAGNFMGGKKDI